MAMDIAEPRNISKMTVTKRVNCLWLARPNSRRASLLGVQKPIDHDCLPTLTGAKANRFSTTSSEISRLLDQTMPEQFTEFKKVTSKTTVSKSGDRVLKYGFTFRSDDGKLIQEQLTIVPTSKNVFYLGAWIERKDFKKVETDLENIVGSFSLEVR